VDCVEKNVFKRHSKSMRNEEQENVSKNQSTNLRLQSLWSVNI